MLMVEMPWFCSGRSLLPGVSYRLHAQLTIAERRLAGLLEPHELGHTGPEDVEVEEADARRPPQRRGLGERERQVGGDGALPHAALARRDDHDLLDAADARALRGSSAAWEGRCRVGVAHGDTLVSVRAVTARCHGRFSCLSSFR